MKPRIYTTRNELAQALGVTPVVIRNRTYEGKYPQPKKDTHPMSPRGRTSYWEMSIPELVMYYEAAQLKQHIDKASESLAHASEVLSSILAK